MKCPVCINGELLDNVMDYQTNFKGEYVLVKMYRYRSAMFVGSK